jgi:PAS domain S-box-containing protein
MLAAPTRVSSNWPVIGFLAAAVVETAHLLLFPLSGVTDAAMELGALGAVVAGGAIALRQASVAGERLDRAETRLTELERTAVASTEIVQGAGEAIIVIDDQASIVTFNRAAERMFGYSAAEMIGTSLERLMTEGARQAHAAYLAETGVTAMVEAARLRTVHKGVRKRGDIFTFELIMTEWSDEGRRMFTGLMRDVTSRERTADALRDAETRFNELFEAVGDPMFVFALGADGGFVLDSMNRAAEEVIGVSRFAAIGFAPEQLGKDEGRALKRALLAALASREPLEADVPLTFRGKARTAALSVSPMRDGGGEIQRILVRLANAARPAAGKAA